MSDDGIKVLVKSEYLADKSIPEENRFVFCYQVSIENQSESPTQILGRHWFVTDGDGDVEEIRGPGIVGERPWIEPGEIFEYMSGAILKTPVGAMHGHYEVITDQGAQYQAAIPAFNLSIPYLVH